MATTPMPLLTVRTPEDVLALVPVLFGFVPERSVAMLTFGSKRPFHARVDLPRGTEDIPAMVQALVEPVRRHRVPEVFLVVYADDARLSTTITRALLRAFDDAGVRVIDALRADGNRWFPAAGRRRGVPEWGVPYDVSAHRFVAEAVISGRVMHGSREDLRATLASEPARVAGVVAALAALTGDPPSVPGERLWVRETVGRHVCAGTVADDREIARLLRATLDPAGRDATWTVIDRTGAEDHARFWTDVVRRAPDGMVAGPAAVLAFAAWLSGDGALAWCAYDRCVDADPDNALAAFVAELLVNAVPPHAWAEIPGLAAPDEQHELDDLDELDELDTLDSWLEAPDEIDRLHDDWLEGA